MAKAEIIEFAPAHPKKRIPFSSTLSEFALDKCEEMIRLKRWHEFGYWHRVYLVERTRTIR